MERNVNYPIVNLHDIAIRLAWAQLELYADDVDQIQVIASGDEYTLGDLRIAVKDDTTAHRAAAVRHHAGPYARALDAVVRACAQGLGSGNPRQHDQRADYGARAGRQPYRAGNDLRATSRRSRLTAGKIALRTTTGIDSRGTADLRHG